MLHRLGIIRCRQPLPIALLCKSCGLPNALPLGPCRLAGHRVYSTKDFGGPGGAPPLPTISQGAYAYLLDHLPEPEVLAQIRRDTATACPGRESNQVAPEQARFLAWLLECLSARRVLEVGVFTGYSSTAMALVLPEGGELWACEKDENVLQMARLAWTRAGVLHKISEAQGAAVDTLERLLADGQAGSFDFAFIDADKRSYQSYLDLCLQLVRPGGVIAIDNILWYGGVADPTDARKATVALREFNDRLMSDPRVSVSLVTVGDGMALCRRKM
eukprot:jgi/Botrbrau1/8970/Bobra.0148s0079.3